MSTKATVLVVDDEPGMRRGLRAVLERAGFEVLEAGSGEEALALVAERELGLVVSDMKMPGLGGLELLKSLKAMKPGLPVVMITAYGTVADAVCAMKEGAEDFLTKPFSPTDLLHLVNRLVSGEEAAAHPRLLSGTPQGRPTFRPIITRDARLMQILEIIEAVADSRVPVLIQGESGTGKELLARHLHACSRRRCAPLVAVNCAALPRDLLESELFGHEKGAFTGAIGRKLGKFEQANGGTLLLDEISELEMGLQAKLLRVLQEWEVDRVGGAQPIPVDVRVVATTNRSLRQMVSAGTFRRDLYYRLNVIAVSVPALRERKGDIDLLIDHFLTRFGGHRRTIDASAREFLRQHSWPGNVRELENLIERATLLNREGPLTVADFMTEERADPAGGEQPSLAGLTVREIEKRLILDTLKFTNNNRSHAARMLGISIRTLRNKLAEYRTIGELGL